MTKTVKGVIAAVAAVAVIGGGVFAYANMNEDKNDLQTAQQTTAAVQEITYEAPTEKAIEVTEVTEPATVKEEVQAVEGGSTAATEATESASAGKPADSKAGYISVDEAKSIAAKHAGFSADSVKFVSAKLDTDDYFVHYDVEFFSGDYEYDYEIDARTGKVLEFDKEYEKQQGGQKTGTSKAADTSKFISQADAKAAALKHAGLSESDIRNFKIELDTDDLIAHYEIEFMSGKYEYDYDINAKTGRIISSEKEIDR